MIVLTDATGAVDARPAGLMLSIADIARRKGVSKQAISKRVARLEQLGQIATHKGPRGTVLVSLAEYDRAVGETSELAHVQAPQPKVAAAAAADAEHSYTREQAREKAYAADLKKLDLDERLGKLVPIEHVQHAAVRLAETLVRILDQLQTRSDDIAAAVGKEGSPGARRVLKEIGRDARETMARELERLAETAQAEHQGGAEEEE